MTRSPFSLRQLAVLVPIAATLLVAGCGKSTPRAEAPAVAPTTATHTAGSDPSPGPTSSSAPTTSSSTRAPHRSGPAATGTSTTGGKAAGASRGIPPAHPVPAAFRPAPGAPSDAEVRAELAQMSAIQRRQYQQSLSAAAANLAGLLPWSLEPKSGIQVSVASVFTDYGLGLACGGLLGRDQLGVAHKTAPCGTMITFTYAGRSITVPVIDRGPYIAGREWDLTGATAEALGFPGLGQIDWSLAG
jgi:rare lipoprotein A (peptidoglycan hydrolase)